MNAVRFYQLLLFVLGGTVLLFQVSTPFLPSLAAYQNLFWIGQCFFVTLCVVSFYIAKRLATHKNKNFFSQFILMFILNKMLFSIGILIFYTMKIRPIDKVAALFPYLILYLIYTVFSVFFLMKIGKEKV